ncbi:hypothetical protein [Streptomyces parvus]|uniref:hypothetical protein n=1 Tax=Streptomyces parvus TaxID=66428 RepID=UPI002100C6F6|nr:hypothetical protein [Streptomyces parvus]MCQ1577169.1 hypothetical protein [Streptomyces parvus]
MGTTFTKQLADGRTAHVTPALTAFGDVAYDAIDEDGRRIVSGWLQEATQRGVAPERRPAGCTHLIAGLSPLWFTAEEATELAALGEQAKAAFDASEEGQQLAAWREQQETNRREAIARTAVLRSPEGEALVRQRDRLLGSVEALLDAGAEQRARAHDDEGGDPGLYYRVQQPKTDGAVERAQAELDAFDAEHPEIVAALVAEQDAARDRFLDID